MPATTPTARINTFIYINLINFGIIGQISLTVKNIQLNTKSIIGHTTLLEKSPRLIYSYQVDEITYEYIPKCHCLQNSIWILEAAIRLTR
jgi:hypothetical protein